MTYNYNLFPLPYWAPALRRVPKPLQLFNEAYRCGCRCKSGKVDADGLLTLHAAPCALSEDEVRSS